MMSKKTPDTKQQTKRKLLTETVKSSVTADTGSPNRPAGSREETKDVLVVRNRVVDPEGKPVAGAKLYLLDFPAKAMPPQVRATSAADGRFDFTVPKGDVRLAPQRYVNPWGQIVVMAVAEGYGPAWGPAIA